MCGRTRCTMRADDFVRACHLNSRPFRSVNMNSYQPSYNVAPGFNMPVIYGARDGDESGIVLHCMKWGLIPSFTKKNEKIDHFKMFNARAESIKEKASFRRLIPKNRCLVSVEGFYEWKKDASKKQPYYIHFKDGRPLVLAALFDSWKNSEGDEMYTFTIITTSASSSLEWLHDRMPVILGDKESTKCWLDDNPLPELSILLKPYEGKDLVWYPVTPAVGKISFDGPECVREVKPHLPKTISHFFSKKDVYTPKREESPVKEEITEVVELKDVKNMLITKVKDKLYGDDGVELKLEAENQDEHGQFIDEVNRNVNYDCFSGCKRGSIETYGHGKALEQSGSTRKKNRNSNDTQATILSFFGRRS